MKQKSNTTVVKKVNKKPKKAKIIAFSIIAVAVVSFIAVMIIYLCGGYDDLIGTKDGKYAPIKSSKEESETVGKIDGYKVKYEELRYIAYVVKDRYKTLYGEDVWTNEEKIAKYKPMLEKEVMDELCGIYATLSICDEVDVKTNSKDAKSYVDAQMAEIINKDFGGDIEKYSDYLAKYHLTDAFNRFKIRGYYLDNEAKQTMVANGHECIKYSDKDVNAFIDYVLNEDDFYRTVHVYYERGKNDADTEKEMAALCTELSDIADKDERLEKMNYYIGHSGSFDGHSGDYKEGYVTETKAGFYVTDGVLGDEYDEAVRKIDVYDVTTAKTDYGYFLIMRLPKERSHISSKLDSILKYYYEKAYSDYKAEVAKNLTFEPNEYYLSLDILNLD